MKTNRIDLRASQEDSQAIIRASEKLHPGKKVNASRTIRSAIEMAATNEPELFFCNRPALKDIDINIAQGQTNLQSFISEFLAVAGKPITFEEAQDLFNMGRSKFGVADHTAIKELVINKLVEGKSTAVGGLQLSEEMLKSLLILPDLAPLFIAADKVFNVHLVAWQERFFWNAYRITEDYKVIIIPEEVESIKNEFRCYADTVQERAKLARVRNLCRVLDSFLDDKTITPEKLNIREVCYFDSESGRFEPSEYYVKYGIR